MKEKLMEDPQESLKLKSKDECEQQLAVELSLGVVNNIDSLIEKGHETACEYACQLLFDNLRQKVAEQSNLPFRIVQHLLNDRCKNIRLEVMRTNWGALTSNQQEKTINDIEYTLSQETDREKKNYQYGNRGKNPQIRDIIKLLLKDALLKRAEAAALRYIKMLGLAQGLHIAQSDMIPVLKDMPNVFNIYWNHTKNHYHRADIILAHPDENARMDEIVRILDKKTRISHLMEWQQVVGKTYRGDESLKTRILKLWVIDPSEKIRKYIATNTTSVSVLEILTSDKSTIISRVAYPRYKKLQKRTEYSKAYHERKQKEEYPDSQEDSKN